MYKRFVRAAIFTHKAMCLTITHKGHIMWRHVAFAMTVPGGLGKKREDWLEHQHQVGKLIREHYRRMQNSPQTRADAIAGASHKEFHPKILAKGSEVAASARRGKRKDYISKDEQRKVLREDNRIEALLKWESLNQHIIDVTDGTGCHPGNSLIFARLPALGEERVFIHSRE